MTTDTKKNVRNYWRGLGLWNFYFIAKLILYWLGYVDFHALYNLAFASALLLPLPPLWLHRLRHVVAIPVGIALLYYDSWFPPFERLLAQPEVMQFSGVYLLELLNRFINWDMVGAGLILFVGCLFLSQWIRVTVISVAALMVAALPEQVNLPHLIWNPQTGPAGINVLAHTASGAAPEAGAVPAEQQKTVSEILTTELTSFFDEEASRTVQFESRHAGQDFDIIFLSICSLSWDDLKSVQLDQHPVLKQMDVVFDEFNSATSYSGPAIIRLLRSSCGQSPHDILYEDAEEHCYLFNNLTQLGYQTEALLNHTGAFQGFASDVTQGGSLPEPQLPTSLRPQWTAFDGSQIWSDYQTLHQWWEARQLQDDGPRALLYNSITLHDGNREATSEGDGRSSPYDKRGQTLLDDLNAFMKQLENSGRRVVVVFIPEHGASLEGDMMQIAGMREIPTPEITHVPVGLKVIGHTADDAPAVRRVSGPSSYQALSEVLARMLATDFGDTGPDWDSLLADLPQTRAISENGNTVLMSHSGVPYVRLGERDWIEYRR